MASLLLVQGRNCGNKYILMIYCKQNSPKKKQKLIFNTQGFKFKNRKVESKVKQYSKNLLTC